MIYKFCKGDELMTVDLQELKTELCKKLLSCKIEHHNENTYNFSCGYRKCLSDLIRSIDSKNE